MSWSNTPCNCGKQVKRVTTNWNREQTTCASCGREIFEEETVKLHGYDVSVGDKVWSSHFGWGNVSSFRDTNLWPIDVTFECGVEGVWYTTEGKIDFNLPVSLFWDEVKIDPPKKKQKVKVWHWAYAAHDAGHAYNNVTTIKRTEEQMREWAAKNGYEIIGRVIETEEEILI